jgi:proteasome accessory factor C
VSRARRPPEPAAAARPEARDRLRRVLFMVPYAVRHPGVPVAELARRCGVSERELLDDLDFLLDVGCPPFAPDDFLDLYVEAGRVHVALHQSFSRPPRFTESEAAALAAAARALGGEGVERAVKALRDSVPRDRKGSFDELSGRIYAGSPPAPGSVLGRLQAAIAERRAVELVYYTPSRQQESERTVHPYTLVSRLGHWYLWGHDRSRDRAVAFRVDRIKKCSLGADRFQPPDDSALPSRLFSDPAGEPVRIRLGPAALAWARERPGLRIVQEGPKGAVVEVAGVDAGWAPRVAHSFAGEAEVIAPAAARSHFAEAVRRALARYGAAGAR